MSTRANIIIKQKDTGYKIVLYHHTDGYFEGVGYDIRDGIFKKYISKYNTFTISCLLYEFTAYDPIYREIDEGCIASDIEFLYVIEITSPTQVTFTCWDVPCFGEYDIKTGKNCEMIYKEVINMSGLRTVVVDYQEEAAEDEECSEAQNNIEIDKSVQVIDDAKNALTYISDKNMLIDKVVDKQYVTNMTKEKFTSILKDFYDLVAVKIKLDI